MNPTDWVDPSKDDLGPFKKRMQFFLTDLMITTPQKAMYEKLQANRQYLGELTKDEAAGIRVLVRKKMKPMMKKAVMDYHKKKLEAFKSQRACWKVLMKVHVTMKCAALSQRVSGFVQPNGAGTPWKIMVKKGAVAKYTSVCMESIQKQVKLGEAYAEMMMIDYIMGRYSAGKKEYIKGKKMMQKVSESDMKMSTLVDLVVYPIFEEGGLYDQENAFQKKETTALKAFVVEHKLWVMNMNLPEEC